MRRLAALALVLAGCAHRYPLTSTEPLHALAGVPLGLGNPAVALPEGTRVRWDFGDGSSATDASVKHAFAHAGKFTVTEFATDADGERRASLEVEVERRSPLMAVPPQADTAVIFDRVFERADKYQALLAKAFSPTEAEAVLGRAREALGFDPLSADQVRAAGLALDEGAAWVSFAEEPKARYMLLGTSDEAVSDLALRALLTREGATISDGPDGFQRAHIPGASDDLLFRHDRGYLIVRVPGDRPEPPLALPRFAASPDLGLAGDVLVQKLRAQLDVGDVLVYRSRNALLSSTAAAQPESLAAHLQALVASVSLGADFIDAQVLVGVDEPARPKLLALFTSKESPALADRAPANASLYAAFSGDLSELLALADRGSSGARGKLDLDLADQGIDFREALALLGNDGAIAAYFDAPEFYRALAATQIPIPRGDLLAELRVRNSDDARSLAQRLLTDGRQAPSVREAFGGVRLESTLAGHPAGAFVNSDSLLLSWGLRRLDDAIAPSGAPRLREQLVQVVPADALGPGRLVLYVDIASVMDQLELRRPVPGLSPEELMHARLMTQLATGPFKSIRDLVAVVQTVPLGIRAGIRLRLR